MTARRRKRVATVDTLEEAIERHYENPPRPARPSVWIDGERVIMMANRNVAADEWLDAARDALELARPAPRGPGEGIRAPRLGLAGLRALRRDGRLAAITTLEHLQAGRRRPKNDPKAMPLSEYNDAVGEFAVEARRHDPDLPWRDIARWIYQDLDADVEDARRVSRAAARWESRAKT